MMPSARITQTPLLPQQPQRLAKASPGRAALLLAGVALLCALLALGLAGMVAYQQRALTAASQTREMAGQSDGLAGRLATQESTVRGLEEAVQKLNAQVAQLQEDLQAHAAPSKAGEAPIASPVNADLQGIISQKIAALEQAAGDTKQQLANAGKHFAMLAVLEQAAARLEQGLSLAPQAETLGQGLAADLPALALANKLSLAAQTPLPGDGAMLAAFRGMVPDLLNKEKMAQADTALKKLQVQLETLVVIRPRAGEKTGIAAPAASPLQLALNNIETALQGGLWQQALSQSTALAEKITLPAYHAWLQQLQQRVLVEQLLEDMRRTLRDQLQGGLQAGAPPAIPPAAP